MIRKALIALAFAGTAMALPAAPAAAQASPSNSAFSLHAGELVVPINKSQVVTADRPIDRAMVGNAEIADVLPISDRSVYVLGKKMGTTSFTLYDNASRVIAVMDISVGPDVEAIKGELSELIPNQPIDARLSNGQVVLTGLVSDAGAADKAARIAGAYAGGGVINLISVGGSQQVMLEVRFAEVSRTIGEQVGVSALGGSSDGDFRFGLGNGASVRNGDTGSVVQVGEVADSFGVLGGLFNIGNVNIEAFLDALERKGLSKTLAKPTLVALSGERASFLAGGEFPIPVAQSSSGGGGGGANAITVEFKPFGVSLGFTPTVLGDKVINLVVEPEVSSIDSSASVTINGLVVPGLQTRRASTTLELRDGESFALAGLLRNDFQTTVRQVPLLGNIPILGALFRSTSFQKGDTELMIVVTPRLVKPIRPDQVRLPTDAVKEPTAAEVIFNGDEYQPKALPPTGAPAPAAEGTDYEF